MSQVLPSNPTVAAPTAPLWLPVFSTAFVVVNLITSEFLPVSLLTPIAHDLGISEGAAGQMISATSIAAVFTSLLTASVTRRLDRKVVLLIASAALVLSNVLVALSPNLIVIMLARLLLGLAMGGFWSLSNATALRLVPRSFLPRALAIISGGVALANVVAAPLGSLLGAALGWRGVFVIAALLGVAGLVWQWVSLPRMAPGRPAELKTLVHLLERRQVQVGMAALLLTFGGFMTFFAYLRPFLEQVTQIGVAQISGVLLILGVAGLIGTALSSRLLTWNLRRTHILVPLVMGVLTLGLLFVGHAPLWTILLLTLWGLTNSVLPVAWGNWVAHAVPDEPESAGGLQVAAIQFGMTLGAGLGGLAFDDSGSTGLLLGSGAALLAGALLIWKGLSHQTAPALEPLDVGNGSMTGWPGEVTE
ncbi:MFS transporter [Deinococcus sp.]|uniref:MFS transporter n=1 Tax=Deinococcus sp. TaxID=47478 RepID=UPI003B5972C9